MSNSRTISFTVDSVPGPFGFAQTARLADDSWPTQYHRPYEPFVFDYSNQNIPTRFPLSGKWLYVDASTSGECYVVFEDKNTTTISDPVYLCAGMVIDTDAAYMRVVAVERAGHIRVVHGVNSAGRLHVVPLLSESKAVETSFIGCLSWTAYQSPSGDPSKGTVRVGPVECGVSGVASVWRNTETGTGALTTNHFHFLQAGYATMCQDPDLIGTVTGGIFVREFVPVFNIIVNGVASGSSNSCQLTAWMFPAIYYKLTALGVAAGAGLVVPDKHYQTSMTRFYNRSQTEFAVF
jgi:hypothetical protein